ncbi:acyltransferase family protein [Luteibacter anthropi]|uniref:Acyltransferase n=1 Tax=Luteibacter anthropi TaxID=564369 RepID=A0A7X5U800_9GAMM|nr:acyltransferase [Luteibacter anthropi]NII05504.1 acyltransferase [Luteibacter anthropi]
MRAPVEKPGTKTHFLALDGLRGVAALLVVIYHVFEAYFPDQPLTQPVNHGYLAVDFFFLLSGFVIAYAYDDRWTTLSTTDFFKRRLIRLQPMVIAGSIVGAIFFYPQASDLYPLIAGTPLWQLLLVMVVGCTLIPLTPGLDIRGWSEMHPLNGPAWSLFFEYVANILYALVLRRLSRTFLAILTLLAAALLVQVAVFGESGTVIGGWSLDATQLHIGFARLLFPFLAGMLLMRTGWHVRLPAAFGLSSMLLVIALAMPRLGGSEHPWVNGAYEALCIMLVFPLVIAIGAGTREPGKASLRIASTLGRLSYPIYITHYPLIYLYRAWAHRTQPSAMIGASVGAGLLLAAIAIAWSLTVFYDEPVRRWLARKVLR